MPSRGLFTLFILLFTFRIFGLDPLILDEDGGSGLFIGEYLEYLSEGDLFPLISSDWPGEKEFVDKILSGHLSNDARFLMAEEAVPGGYRYTATLRRSGESVAFEWGIDDLRRLDVEELFRPFDTEIPACDFTPHSCWLRFRLDNRTASPRTVYLELDKYLFSAADIFYSVSGSPVEQRMEFTEPMSERKVNNRNMTAALKLPPGETLFFMRVDSWFDDVVPLRLWSEESYMLYLARDNAILGLISGIFILLMLYALFLALSGKMRSYFYLFALTLCTFLIQLTVSGFGFQHLWPGNPATGIVFFYAGVSLTMIFVLLFCREYIPSERRTLPLEIYVFGLAGLIALATAVMYAVPFSLQSRIFSSLILLDHIYYLPLMIPAVGALRRKDSSGAFLLAALAVYAFSQAEWFPSNRDLIPYSLVNYLNVKGLLFVILMAAGLHYKFRAMSALIAGYRIRLEEIRNKLSSKSVTDESAHKLEQIKEFIKENYREEISREGLAAASGLSPDHLGRIFKLSEGVTLGDFINDLRIRDAARMLIEEKDRKVIDIAFSVGFNSLRTFNKVFSNSYHLTPSDYRKAGGATPPADA